MCPQPPLSRSTSRITISRPRCPDRSTTTRSRSSRSSPDARKTTWPVSLRTSSTHVAACEPPPTRKLANGFGHPERHGRQRPLGRVAALLVGADPEPARVPAVHVAAAPADRVSLDRLTLEGFSFGRPVGQGARLEAQVEGPARCVRRECAGRT